MFMIVTKSVAIKVISNHIEKYRELGYTCSIGDIINIKIEDLGKGSHSIITTKCDYCGNIKDVIYKEYNRNILNGGKFSCSRKCSSAKSTISNLLKYGVEHTSKLKSVKEKQEKSNIEKYGCKSPTLNSDIIEKQKRTNLERYGVDNYSKTDEYKEKCKKTNLERYGVDNYSKTDICKEKVREACLEKYGTEYYTQTDEYKERYKKTCLEKYGVYHISQINSIIGNDINYLKYVNETLHLFRCDKGHTFEINNDNYYNRNRINISLCTICNPIGYQSSFKEKDLYEYIKSIYNREIITSYRDGLEIDIFLPELNLGFEFNGLYWHSNKFKEKNYHSNKTNYFKDNGIRIIHIWEDDWTFKTDIVKSQISNLLKNNTKKIFARKCIIKEVDTKIARQFLDDHHIQSKVNSTIKLGLYFEDELVSIMTFDTFEGRKKMEEGGYNLSRFCNKINTNVVGGASKLLKNFLNTYNPTRIVSYADKDWSIGSLYYILGFENIGDNDPDYKYIVENKRVHKSRYKKSKLKTELTEEKATEKLGILKIYDCGKLKFEKII